MTSRAAILDMLKRNADYNDNAGSSHGAGYIGGCAGCRGGCQYCGSGYIGGALIGGKKGGKQKAKRPPSLYNIFVGKFMKDPNNQNMYSDPKDRMRAAAAAYRGAGLIGGKKKAKGGAKKKGEPKPKAAAKPRAPAKRKYPPGTAKADLVPMVVAQKNQVEMCRQNVTKLRKNYTRDQLYDLVEKYDLVLGKILGHKNTTMTRRKTGKDKLEMPIEELLDILQSQS